jgi:endo-1,4-beta-mannosidase
MADRPSRRLPTERPWLGVNYWSRVGGPLMWRHYDDDVVRTELRALVAHGVTLVRSFCHWPDFHPLPDTIDDTFVDRYRRFLTACEDVGMATIPTFIVGHMSGENLDVKWRNGRDLYADGFMLGQQAFFIREIVRRLAGSPAIVGWLISNEMPRYAGTADHSYVRAWGLVCASAVRAGGSALPVSLGDGGWTQEVTGRDNGFRLRDQLDTVDFFGPHAYPAGDDQTRLFAEAAFACEMSHLGKPVVLEEFGVTGAFASDEHGAHYYRQVLHQSLLAGATGWIAWNNTDFDLPHQEPYQHHAHELGFGVTRTDGSPKPALLEIAAFKRVLDLVDLDGLERAPTRTAIVLPGHVDLDLPFVLQADREIVPRITLHAWLAARTADLSPAIMRESEPLPDADLVIVPANKALLGTTFTELARRAREGVLVYFSWFCGMNDLSRGAWWPDLETLFGARHTLRYGLVPTVTDTVELTVVQPFGDLTAGTTLTFPTAGLPQTRAFLPLEPTSADVLAIDGARRPALLRQRTGTGACYLGAYPIEYFGAMRPAAHDNDETWRLYQALAIEAGITPEVKVTEPRVWTDHMFHRDGTHYTWLVSSLPDTVTVDPAPCRGVRLIDIVDGSDATGHCTLPPYGVKVLRHSDG